MLSLLTVLLLIRPFRTCAAPSVAHTTATARITADVDEGRRRRASTSDQLALALADSNGIAASIDNTIQAITRTLPPRFWLASKGKNFCFSLGIGRLSAIMLQVNQRIGFRTWFKFTAAKRGAEVAARQRVKKVCFHSYTFLTWMFLIIC